MFMICFASFRSDAARNGERYWRPLEAGNRLQLLLRLSAATVSTLVPPSGKVSEKLLPGLAFWMTTMRPPPPCARPCCKQQLFLPGMDGPLA